jgi:pSer/pThr/pTyr-binding forkhead associated (FHA) protein
MLLFRKRKDSGRPPSVQCLTVIEVGPDSGVAVGDSFPLNVGENVIGRDSSCEVIIKGPAVSRRHASVRVSHHKSQVVIADLGSHNGTLVRPDICLRAESRPLQSGAEIQIGETVLRLSGSPGQDQVNTMTLNLHSSRPT